MNKTHLQNVLAQYVNNYDMLNDVNGNDEGYKWRATSCFQANWNIEAEDFVSMFKSAYKEMSNLIDNSTVQPVGGILMLLNHTEEIEFVRNCFRELFIEDGGDIDARQERVDAFIEKINSHIDIYAKGSWKYPQQRNNVIYYLNLWKPHENYIYKATEATKWADCIEFGDDFGSGSSFSLRKYYKMCDELLAELKQNDVIMQLYAERMATVDNFDDQGHILVYDIIYCAKAYDLYRNIPTFKKVSVKQRIKLAQAAEKREYLLEAFSELSSEIEQLANRMILPDISGKTVKHQQWGLGGKTVSIGKVLSCGEGSIDVEFSDGIKKMKYPDSINKFLFLCDGKLAQLFEDRKQAEEEKKALESELERVKRELKIYTA